MTPNLGILSQIADGEIDGKKVSVADQLRAIDLMAKYGLGTAIPAALHASTGSSMMRWC